jgi:GT2 family glycosyltransferase
MTVNAQRSPKVAVVMCTIIGPRQGAARDTTADDVVDCVRSILTNSYEPMELLVVDQSPTDVVESELRPIAGADSRLRYLHSDVAGLTRSQNIAVNSSDADVFAFTDDDCVVEPQWVEHIVDTFRRKPDAGMAFGEVRPPAGFDWNTSFVPQIIIQREQRLPAAFLPRVNNLLGANMAVKRDTFERVGLFEQGLPSVNGEVELALRALRARPSINVYLTPAFSVVHEHGARPQGRPAQRLLRSYHMGKSAMLVKHTLRGDIGAACRLALLAFEPFVDATVNLVRIGRPRGIGMILPYFQGIRRGFEIVRRGNTDVRLSHV